MLALALWLLTPAAFGVADRAQRFTPVPSPARVADPCPAVGAAGRWVKMAADGAPRSLHDQSWLDSAAVWDGARLVVAARKDRKWNGTALDPCRNVWSPIAETPALARSEPWLADDHDRPFQPSTQAGSYDGFERISVWDFERKAWATVKVERPPLAPRSHYAVALVGGRLFVWGGWTHTLGALGDGAVLDVHKKSWKKLAAPGAPSPRLEPAAVVWTGSRLVIWGGQVVTASPTAVPYLGDGALYDPAADRWTAMSAENAPSPRTAATAIWTGRKLVVLGGTAGGPPLRDGGVYDPAANRWTPLTWPAAAAAPPKNVGPLTRIMIAPDGRVVILPDNLGTVFVLDADRAAWSTIAADEGPGKRVNFRAFLAGRRLMIWGGMTVVAEHICPPPVPGRPICDSFAETAPRHDGWMIVLPE